jgi:hypothetical protein
MFSGNIKAERFNLVLKQLEQAGQARCEMVPTGGRGRPTETWFAV